MSSMAVEKPAGMQLALITHNRFQEYEDGQ